MSSNSDSAGRHDRGSAGLTVGEIADVTGAALKPGTRAADLITGVAALEHARSSDLAFLASSRYASMLESTRAGACLMTERFVSRAPSGLNVLCTDQPYQAFVKIMRILFRDALRPSSPFETTAIDATAIIHPSAEIGRDVTIDPGAVIGPRVMVGDGAAIGAMAVIGASVRIGPGCSIGPNTTITHAVIGENVIIHPGCHIGQDGFRYLLEVNEYIKVPQVGRVIIEANVEIGAGTTVDRGGAGDTVIGAGTKIDNLVHIAHNVTIGRYCIIAGQCGLAGSVTLEDRVMLGGQVGIADHLTIGRGAMIGAKSGVISNIPPGERWFGYPASRGRDFFRGVVALRKLIGTHGS
jgi:UDP-3-O-[3-hydroxymyristoyl] glucosamine N-acyltransferase